MLEFMPKTIIDTFSVTRLDILDTEGNADESLLPSLSREDTLRLYELLVLSRAFDGRALNLQREGRIGTYPSILGQEAAQVGSAFALEKSDWVFPSFRETGMHITLGYPLDLLFRYWSGDERGLAVPMVSISSRSPFRWEPIIPHAVGAAMAARYRGDQVAVVAYFGDGATSKGDFHEGFNYGRCLPPAGGVHLPEQPVGHFRAPQSPDRRRHPGPEGLRLWLRGDSGGRQ